MKRWQPKRFYLWKKSSRDPYFPRIKFRIIFSFPLDCSEIFILFLLIDFFPYEIIIDSVQLIVAIVPSLNQISFFFIVIFLCYLIILICNIIMEYTTDSVYKMFFLPFVHAIVRCFVSNMVTLEESDYWTQRTCQLIILTKWY